MPDDSQKEEQTTPPSTASSTQAETTAAEKPTTRSRIWRVFITLLILVVLGAVVAQGVVLYKIYSRLQQTSRSLADEILTITQNPSLTLDEEGHGPASPGQDSMGDSLDLLNDLLGGQPGAQGSQDLNQTLRGLLDSLQQRPPGVPQLGTPQAGAGANAVISTPTADVYVADGRYTMLLDMPGIDTESITISSSNRTLTVSAAVKTDQPEVPKGGTTLTRERTRQAFQRILELPTPVKQSAISWDYSNGVLTVKAPQG